MPYNLTGFNVINGTANGETLTGGNGNDAIYGNGGADRLIGGAGTDVLFGSATGGTTFVWSHDSTWGNSGARNVGDPDGAGTNINYSIKNFLRSYDVFVGSGANNTLEMGDGKRAVFLEDTLSPGVGVQRLFDIQNFVLGSGGQMVDLTSTTIRYGDVNVTGGSGNDFVFTNVGADTVSGGDGADTLWGGSGNDSLSGDAGNDVIGGGTGDDVLNGGAGVDTMTGGAGNDTYHVDVAGDIVTEVAGAGTDTVVASFTYTLGAELENLTLSGTAAIDGTGNSLANVIIGNDAANVLYGMDGNDTLNGMGGADTLVGGNGDDTYVVGAGDIITEFAGQGTDSVFADMTYSLGAELERLTLTGTAAIDGTGNALDNLITGNTAANVLDGGLGNDVILAGDGNDTVKGGDGNDDLRGEAGNDRLEGGVGIDTLTGGIGDDTYVIDDASDTVVEVAGEGLDTVFASVDYTLTAGVENLTLTGSALTGTGNELDNRINGNALGNLLEGGLGKDTIYGAHGADLVRGGDGDDRLFGEFGNDRLEGGNGNDSLNGGADQDILFGQIGNDYLFGGGGNDRIAGGDGVDRVWGDGGNDIIYGGKGDDFLKGGDFNSAYASGNDTFAWALADVVNGDGSRAGFDRIADFGVGDKLDLSDVFAGPDAGPASSMVRFTEVGGSTLVSLNINGSWVDAMQLDGVTGLNVDTMAAGGWLIT